MTENDIKALQELREHLGEGGITAIEDMFGIKLSLGHIFPKRALQSSLKIKGVSEHNHGLRACRTASNQYEETAARLWDEQNKDGGFLSWLLGDGGSKGHPTRRDEVVAATMMQWLGSPVGRGFLGKLLDKFKKLDEGGGA